jgi:hypothetical protein
MPFTDSRFPHLKGVARPSHQQVPAVSWVCGYCSNKLASSAGSERAIGGVGTAVLAPPLGRQPNTAAEALVRQAGSANSGPSHLSDPFGYPTYD